MSALDDVMEEAACALDDELVSSARAELAALRQRVERLEKLAKATGRQSMVQNMLTVMATGHFGNCEWYRGGECTCLGGGSDVDYSDEIKKYGAVG